MKKNTNKKNNFKRTITFFKVNVFLSILFACILLVLINFCASRIYVRYHYDSLIPHGLSQQSIDILRETKGELKIISIFERSHPFRKPARKLLKEYQELSKQIPQFNIEIQIIDANLDITETATILKQYDVEVNSIIISRGLESKCISEAELSGNSIETNTQQANPASNFIGESICTLTIHKLLRTESSKIYFLTGHGEYNPNSADRHTGASNIARLLELYDNEIDILNLNKNCQIPKDCDILTIAGPTTIFSETEINAISTYLNNGGKALFLFDSYFANGLAPLLNIWNIQISAPLSQGNKNIIPVTTTIYNRHEITEPLTNIATTFSSPCYLSPASDIHLTTTELADKPIFTPLILSEPSITKEDFPSTIAAAVQLGMPDELGKKQNTRIVVCGDASIISNTMVGQGISGNKLFIFSAIEWLKGNTDTNKIIPAEAIILNSGISANGWSDLAIKLAILLPLTILLLGTIVISPILKKL